LRGVDYEEMRRRKESGAEWKKGKEKGGDENPRQLSL